MSAAGVYMSMAGSVTLAVDVSQLDPDLRSVGVLAQIALEARRHGYRVQLRGLTSELRELIALVGLNDVLPSGGSMATWASSPI